MRNLNEEVVGLVVDPKIAARSPDSESCADYSGEPVTGHQTTPAAELVAVLCNGDAAKELALLELLRRASEQAVIDA